ncbi:MAG: hypothetical protein RBR68_11335 [Tenuifilaceae bacterium]|nr:hypothetical protein [Tenuifilaceae bacterium]
MKFNKNNLIPLVTETPSNIGLGYYKIYNNGIFFHKPVMGKSEVVVKVEGISGNGEGKETIKAVNPKIPFSYFWKIIDFFRYVRNEHDSNIESCAAIAYSFKEEKFMIYVPKHEASIASINYNFQDFYKQYKDWYIILMMHCHPGSGANFSSQDDKDDNRDRFEGVVGNISNVMPNYCFRFGTMGKFFNVDINDLFINSDEKCNFDFEKAINNIKVNVNLSKGYVIPNINTTFNIDSLFDKYNLDKDFTIEELMPNW